MVAAEPEVLNALRVHADQGGLPVEWAEVYLHDARNDFSLAWMSEKAFRAILGKLNADGLYKPIDEDRGWIKMSG
jgi:hypothetical protein